MKWEFAAGGGRRKMRVGKGEVMETGCGRSVSDAECNAFIGRVYYY